MKDNFNFYSFFFNYEFLQTREFTMFEEDFQKSTFEKGRCSFHIIL